MAGYSTYLGVSQWQLRIGGQSSAGGLGASNASSRSTPIRQPFASNCEPKGKRVIHIHQTRQQGNSALHSSLVNEYGCNQCFDAGYLYENQSVSLSEILKEVLEAWRQTILKDWTLPTIANFGAEIVSFSTPHFKISDEITANGVFDDGKGE